MVFLSNRQYSPHKERKQYTCTLHVLCNKNDQNQQWSFCEGNSGQYIYCAYARTWFCMWIGHCWPFWATLMTTCVLYTWSRVKYACSQKLNSKKVSFWGPINYISPRSLCNHILITDKQKRTLMITFMRDRFAQNHSAALTRESSATKSIGELQSPHSNHGRMYHFASRERLSNERSWINSATGANTQFFSSETDRDTSKMSFESPKNVSLARRKRLREQTTA